MRYFDREITDARAMNPPTNRAPAWIVSDHAMVLGRPG
jgi:hypothetical protein